MIDGLRLTISGKELRKLLDERIHEHRRRADHWEREAARSPEDQTEDDPVLPEHMCTNESERHEWRADVLEFLRDHIEPTEIYRLAEADLEFGELLPEKPGALELSEYEERTAVGFHLGRMAKNIGAFERCEYALELAAKQASPDGSV